MNFKVTAVIEDVPLNSHLKFSGLFSVSTLAEMYGRERFNSFEPGAFWNIGTYSYIMLKENADIENVLKKFPDFYDKYMAEIGDQLNAGFTMLATPLADVHLTSRYEGDEPTGILFMYISLAL
jgi:putative ABC transport system permease protein